MDKFKIVRFWLFANSYSGATLSIYIRECFTKRKIKYAIDHLSKILDINRYQLEKYIIKEIKPECPYQRVPFRLQVYFEIEQELINLTEEKQDKYSTAREDYQNQLLFPAIERAAGNFLTDVKNDQRFNSKLEEKIRTYRTIYYKVAYKYKLPTIRIVPFIIRLIS